MDKLQILITGGTGYIGSHTAVELIGAGYDVVLVDNLSNSSLKAVQGIRKITGIEVPFVQVNCTDNEQLGNVFRQWQFDAVIHFAAFKAVGESVAEPLKYYRNNIDSLLTVLEQMQATGIHNIVFSSSATVYGQPDALPVTETSPRKPATSPYGATKQICEDILRDTAASNNLKAIALRYFNPIGAHPSALIGEEPHGVPGNLVPFIAQVAAGQRSELSIFGDDYPTPDGTAQRDYIDIVDLARAHVCAVDRILKDTQKPYYEIFNIGTGRPVSVLELVHTFERMNNVEVPYLIAPRRTGDVTALWADPSLAARELGWHAERSLDQSLQSAWLWEQQRTVPIT